MKRDRIPQGLLYTYYSFLPPRIIFFFIQQWSCSNSVQSNKHIREHGTCEEHSKTTYHTDGHHDHETIHQPAWYCPFTELMRDRELIVCVAEEPVDDVGWVGAHQEPDHHHHCPRVHPGWPLANNTYLNDSGWREGDPKLYPRYGLISNRVQE